jgi:hypothetical protein
MIVVASLILLLPSSAQAYLDPGSGSMLLYFLIGVFATLIYSIKNLFFRIKISISRIFSKDKARLKDKKNIVFYSEGKQYWTTFKPVIKELSEMGIECSYYSSDKNDAGLKFQAPNVDTLFIGDGQFSLMSLNYLKAKILVMTTPQIEVLRLKRSKEVKYFVHLVHAPIDIFKYDPFSFDFFDCVMCSGQHQIDHLRLIEQARNLPSKNLLATGLVYFDELLKSKQQKNKEPVIKSKQKTILVAPTWGDNSMLSQVGFKPLKLLLDEGLSVILRPHPQSFVSDAELMQDIEIQCSKYDSITIDKTPNAQDAMQQADIMLGDASGIIFDFAFIYEKPIIAFNDTLNESRLLELFEINDAQHDTIQVWEVENKHKVATEMSIKDIDNLPKLVIQILDSYSVNNMKNFRDESLFNYGTAGKATASQLKQLLNEI